MKNSSEVDVVFLCGGYGSRMGELTKSTQKVMLPYQGKPILQYGLESAVEAFGSINPILAVAYLGDQIRDYFGSHWNNRELTYISHPEGSEDRGALRTVRESLSGGPFVVVHGNIIYEPKALIANYEYQLAQRPISTLSLAKKSDESKHALVRVSTNKIVDISIPDPKDSSYDLTDYAIDTYDDQKEKDLIQKGWLRDMGVNSYNHDIFNIIDKHTEPYMCHVFWMLVDEFKKGSELGGVIYENDWRHFQDLADLER